MPKHKTPLPTIRQQAQLELLARASYRLGYAIGHIQGEADARNVFPFLYSEELESSRAKVNEIRKSLGMAPLEGG